MLSKKQHFVRYVERLGCEFATMLVTLICISYFASQNFALILPGTYSLSHGGGKKQTEFVYVSSIVSSYLKLAKLHTGFSTNTCFLRMGYPKCKQFFKENMDFLKKKNVFFASLSLYISLKQL